MGSLYQLDTDVLLLSKMFPKLHWECELGVKICMGAIDRRYTRYLGAQFPQLVSHLISPGLGVVLIAEENRNTSPPSLRATFIWYLHENDEDTIWSTHNYSHFLCQVRKNYTDFIWEVTLDCNVFESNQELWRSRVNVLVDEFQEKVWLPKCSQINIHRLHLKGGCQ